MQDRLGYLGVPVVAVGLLQHSAAIVSCGLSFLLVWQSISVRQELVRRSRGARTDLQRDGAA